MEQVIGQRMFLIIRSFSFSTGFERTERIEIGLSLVGLPDLWRERERERERVKNSIKTIKNNKTMESD